MSGRWRRRWWAGEAGLAGSAAHVAALPVEAAFRVAVGLRNAAYDRGWLGATVAPLPVVSVGNVVVGGSGKTPFVGWIARRLLERGTRPGILVRGYRDERLLHARWNPGAVLVANPDRVAGAREAAGRGADVAVLDDGMQHRRLRRDVEIVLVPAEVPFPGAMLPRGPYREPASSLARADLIVVTRKTAPESVARSLAVRLERFGVPVASAWLRPAGWSALEGQPAPGPEGATLAVAAVARPEGFARLVEEHTGVRPETLFFRDHRTFSRDDARGITRAAKGRDVVVTEKDAVKLVPYAADLPTVRVLELAVELHEDAPLEALLDRVERSVREGAA